MFPRVLPEDVIDTKQDSESVHMILINTSTQHLQVGWVMGH